MSVAAGAAGRHAQAEAAAATTGAWCAASAALDAGAEEGSPLTAVRARGQARLRRLGWPTTRHEAWRHTSLAHLAACAEAGRPGEGKLGASAQQAVAAHLAATEMRGPRLVFINGRLAPALSRACAGGAVEVRPFGPGGAPPARLDALGGELPRPLSALNSAFLQGGVSIVVAGEMPADEVVQLVFVAVPQDGAVHSHPRLVIEAAANSRAAVLEAHVALAGEVRPQLVNLVTEAFVERGAALSYSTLHQGSQAVVNQFFVRLADDAHLEATALAVGAGWCRHEQHVQLAAPGAQVDLAGAHVGGGDDHHDSQVFVHHQAPKTQSAQDFRGCYDDRAVGVFAGRVDVAVGARRTSARQMSRALLLGPRAAVHTQPHMEILHDDVQCSHGATVGQLDETALFFLTSRGLSAEHAKMLLTYGFLAQICDRVGQAPVAARLGGELRAHFGLPEAARGGWAAEPAVAGGGRR